MDSIKSKLFESQRKLREAEEVKNKAEAELEAVKKEIKEKPELAMETSDHAVVQFMERALKSDIFKYRTELMALCDAAPEMESQNRTDGVQYVYKNIEGPNNTVLTIIVKDNTIVTCYVNEKKTEDL